MQSCPTNKTKFEVRSKECINCKVKCMFREEFIKNASVDNIHEDVSDAYVKYEGKALLG